MTIHYDPELGKEICRKLATSEKGIRRLCAANSHWPSYDVIYDWCFDYPDFRSSYARAKAFQVEWLVEDALERAYDSSRDTYTDDKGKDRCDHEWIGRVRLIVDTVKWLACKLAPTLYGEKIQIEKIDMSSDADLLRAKDTALKLKSDDYGRSSAIKNRPTK